jgi:predicted transporter
MPNEASVSNVQHPHRFASSAIFNSRKLSESIFHKGIVGVAVEPAFTQLSGSDDRMPGAVRVFAGVLIWRAIAAERNSTRLTRPQVDPLRPDLYTLIALAAFCAFDVRNRFEVRTRGIIHDRIISLAKHLMNRGYGD